MPAETLFLNRAVVFASVLVYWGGVLVQARRVRRRIGKSPNLNPRGTKERLLWAGWMFVIIGWVVALGCVFGVFIIHGGNIGVILKALPFEMITIFGAAIGAFLANNQMKVVKATVRGLGYCLEKIRA